MTSEGGTRNSPLPFLSNETPVLKRESFTSKPKLSRFSCRLSLVAKSLIFSRKKSHPGTPIVAQELLAKIARGLSNYEIELLLLRKSLSKEVNSSRRKVAQNFFFLLLLLLFSSKIFAFNFFPGGHFRNNNNPGPLRRHFLTWF